MAKTKNKKRFYETVSGKNALTNFAIFCNLDNPSEKVDDFIEYKKTGNYKRASLKKDTGGNLDSGNPNNTSTANVANAQTNAEPVSPAMPAQQVPTSVTPAQPDTSNPIPGPATGFPGTPTNSTSVEQQFMEAAATAPKGEVDVDKVVQILGRKPDYDDQIGNIFIQKCFLAQRWRVKK